MSDENRQKMQAADVAQAWVRLAERKPESLEPEPGVLNVVATPIGHLGDLGLRTGVMLAQADLVLCEDTRVTKSLYSALGLESPRLERFDASEERGPKIRFVLEALGAGKRVVLVSDAGMSGVSDPGSALVRRCLDEGIEVRGVAGPSALPLAIALSGSESRESRFLGFFPRDKGARDELMARIEAEPVSSQWIWFESPERILGAVRRISEAFPNFRVILCKELTKQYERVFAGSAAELAERLDHEPAAVLKGEWVMILERPAQESGTAPDEFDTKFEPILQAFRAAGVSASVATKSVSQVFGAPKNQLYRLAIKIFGE